MVQNLRGEKIGFTVVAPIHTHYNFSGYLQVPMDTTFDRAIQHNLEQVHHQAELFRSSFRSLTAGAINTTSSHEYNSLEPLEFRKIYHEHQDFIAINWCDKCT